MKKIILVRHGESFGNKTQKLMGCRIGSNLTDLGKSQALEAAKNLQKYNFLKFFSSPVSRALETSEIIKKELNLDFEISESLKEIDFGKMSGVLISEIPKEIDEAFMKNPFYHRHKNGENMQDLFERVGKFLEKIKKLPEKEILIVTHENIIRSFIGILSGEKEKVLDIKIKNCEIVEFIL